MVDGWMVAFSLPQGTPNKDRVTFNHRFWGQVTSTHGGKYTHHRQGLMEEIPHRRLVRGVFLIRKEDADRVADFLKEWGAEHYVRRVRLESGDLDAMGPRS